MQYGGTVSLSHAGVEGTGPELSAVARAQRSLRAVRHYVDRPVDPDLVNGWLETARWCGSSRNSQPWRFFVIRNRRTLGELAILGECSTHLADASLAIVISAVDGPYPFSTTFDLGRVSQSLMLSAHADGVGSCIAIFEPDDNVQRARNLVGVPMSMACNLAIGFGYASEAPAESGPRPSPPGRLALRDLVAFDEGIVEPPNRRLRGQGALR